MTLQQLLETFDTTVTDITVTVLNGADDNKQIVKLNASGYSSLEDNIEAMTVTSWTITSRNSITVIVQ